MMIYPWLLWLLIPIGILYYYRPKELKDTTHMVILVLLVISLSRPVWEQEPQEMEIEARDIIIALDVSYSMRADDIAPDRYSFAVDTINALLRSNVSDNITLIAFTTNPLLLSPPTTDHQLISIALESLERDNIMTKGTSLERLLKKVATLPMAEKNLILITDGGEESDIDRLGEIIESSSISLTILALGTEVGSTITTTNGTKLRDKDGNLVVSRINPLLERLADSYGGNYLVASSTPTATANSIEDAIDSSKMQQSTITKKQKSYIELYQIPLSIAILLFLMLHTRAIKYLIMFVGIWGGSASASIFDAYHLQQAYESYYDGDYNSTYRYIKKIDKISLESQIALASSYYKDGYYKKALKIYKSIRSTSPKIKQMLYYNIANTYAKLEQYSRASRYYTKVLQIGYDSDALHNLNVVALKKSRDLSKLSISKPSSDSSASSKQASDEDSSKDSDDNQNSGSGSGTQNSTKSKEKERKILQESRGKQQPQSSKVYELINKGYIYEKEPW
ncbi:BatB [hydrothermal vent metagenome]|uniref:BatB n=1 Tax=hydrothermal vent metagenome TaxID=652676 RepID=A0A1W1BAE9_9ZZZZ